MSGHPNFPVAYSSETAALLPSEESIQGDRRRVVFVTGAARSIGFSIATRLAKDGFDVAINDIDKVALDEAVVKIEALGVKAVGIQGDVSDEATVEKMIGQVVETFGHLDVMVANAGIAVTKLLIDTTSEDFDKQLRINVRGTHLCYKYAAKQFIKQQTRGKLISAASINGYRASKYLGSYTATKFAVRGLNQAAALEYAPYGITANCYAPGIVSTEAWNDIDGSATKAEGLEKGQFFKGAASIIPLGRTSVPDDVANVVSFLASRNSDYITGQSILVDGGIVMY